MSEPLVLGRYLICEEIGGGGMARVHLGRVLGAAGFSRVVAIKRVHPANAEDAESATMLLDEARLAARIRHPNVVPTLDVVNMGSEVILVMDYVHGPSLSWLMRRMAVRGERAPLPIVMRIILDALAGLHAAHEAKSERGRPLEMVHRDVSPHNVLISDDGAARLADFGIAKADGKLSLTQQGQIRGKLAYMAPEQLRGEAIDRRADLFATGIILWELLTGRDLFPIPPERAVGALVQRLLTATAPPPSTLVEIPAALEAVVLKALRPDAGDRFATAEEMAAALEASSKPATSKELAAWIGDVARDLLEKRASLVAHVEQFSAVHDVAALVPAAGDAASKQPSQPPAGTAELAPPTHERPRKKGLALVLLAIALGGVCAAAALVGLMGRASRLTTTTTTTTTTAYTVDAAVVPLASSPIERVPPSAAPVPPVLASATSATPRAPSVTPASRRHPPPRAAAPDCDPPYSIDSQGVRIPRRECLGR